MAVFLASFLQSTLEDMDMEDEVKTLVSDEIKRFRESYKVGTGELARKGGWKYRLVSQKKRA